MSPDSKRQRKAPSYPAYGSTSVHLPPGIGPMHNEHNLSELSPIGLYLSMSEFTAHEGPKKLAALLTWLLQSIISMIPSFNN